MPVTITYSIPFGTNLRIGYKAFNSAAAYTYLNTFPGPSDSPFSFTLASGDWDIETTTICPNCSGNTFSDPVVSTVSVP